MKSQHGRGARPRGGFTLIEIAVVLVIAGLILSMGISMSGTILLQQRRYVTVQRIQAIDAALALYVSQVQRLPCPADGALPSSDAAAGMEQRNTVTGDCFNGQARGVAPWRTLSMAEPDATDGFYGRITYRVAPGLTRDLSMTLAGCDPAGTALASGAAPYQSCRVGCDSNMANCTGVQPVLAQRGLVLRNAGGTVVMDPNGTPATGAAYVLVSHGENRAGGYNSDGILQDAVGAQMGANESTNSAANALAGAYVEDVINGTDTPAHFDDVLSRPTILAVASKAALGPRAH